MGVPGCQDRRYASLAVDRFEQPDGDCGGAIGLHGMRVCGPSKGHGPRRGQGATARLQRSEPLTGQAGGYAILKVLSRPAHEAGRTAARWL